VGESSCGPIWGTTQNVSEETMKNHAKPQVRIGRALNAGPPEYEGQFHALDSYVRCGWDGTGWR
jgi:hypothetical protein